MVGAAIGPIPGGTLVKFVGYLAFELLSGCEDCGYQGECQQGGNRVVSTVCQPLPIYSNQRTSSE